MLAYFTRVADAMGIRGLDFRLGDRARDRLMWANVPAAALFLALMVETSIQLSQGDPSLGANWSMGWQRTYVFASSADVWLLPLAIATLFLASLMPWRRAEASWLFLAGAVLIPIALLFGIIYAFVITFQDSEPFQSLHPRLWGHWAYSAALLAVGYLFAAYRGLQPAQEFQQRWRRRRRRAW